MYFYDLSVPLYERSMQNLISITDTHMILILVLKCNYLRLYMLFTTIIKSNKDFMKIYKKGKFSANKIISVYFFPNKSPYNRIGITTSKKIGNAVQRNRARRIIRSAYRKTEKLFPIGFDIIFVARPDIISVKSTNIENFLRHRVLKEMNKPGKSKNKHK